MPLATSAGEFYTPLSIGPVLQRVVASTESGLAATVAASGNTTSNLLQSDGFKSLAVGAKSTQTGNVTVQRYLDSAGTIPQGAALTAALTANTAAVLNNNDGAPFLSFTVAISNTGGSTATLTNVGILLQAQ